MTCIATFQHTKPCPGGHEIYNFGTLFLGHHNYKLRLPVLCLGVEWRILKEIMHVHYIYVTWSRSCTRIPVPDVMKFTIPADPSLVIINHTLSLSDLCLGVKKKIFKRNNAFSLNDLYGTP